MNTFARAMKHTVVAAALALLAGCSSVKPWINEPLPAGDQNIPVRKSERDPTILVAVTPSRCQAVGRGPPRLAMAC